MPLPSEILTIRRLDGGPHNTLPNHLKIVGLEEFKSPHNRNAPIATFTHRDAYNNITSQVHVDSNNKPYPYSYDEFRLKEDANKLKYVADNNGLISSIFQYDENAKCVAQYIFSQNPPVYVRDLQRQATLTNFGRTALRY